MSSDEQPENSNNNQPQNVLPQQLSATVSEDYEIYDSMDGNPTSNLIYSSPYSYNGTSSNYIGAPYFHHNGNSYHFDEMYLPDITTDPNEDYSDEIERELEEVVKEITKETGVDNQDEEFLYSDDVQAAFSRYENENSQRWKQKNSQAEMFEQMDECMRYMEEIYDKPEENFMEHKFNNLSEILMDTKLNPDAVEFHPSNFFSSALTNQATVNTVPSTLCEDAKQNEQENP